ncbi:hypothetical protein PROFUN_06882 [Planoprotostelium fungivorum]|uniref:Hexosyltransferase n=1 Tax=Planoprotostelium fungivorum TaxID=1890364 RepID=A0A2P6NMT2_9EUKA|nr:hypothetical protein PROFUN_06882 [Planoprotostelium fungivorum]
MGQFVFLTRSQTEEIEPSQNLGPNQLLHIGVFLIANDTARRSRYRRLYQPLIESLNGVKMSFIIGKPSRVWSGIIKEENRIYSDIITLPIEENMNLGKTYSYFSYMHEHHSFDYVMKLDSDAILNLPRLLEVLPITPEETYMGRHAVKTNFMLGYGYILSKDLVQFIAKSSHAKKNQKGPEDQMLGKWLAKKKKINQWKNYINLKDKVVNHHTFKYLGSQLHANQIIMHKLKTDEQWMEAAQFFRDTWDVSTNKTGD